MKHYITQTIVEYIDGRLNFREVVITRADAKIDKNSARLQDVKEKQLKQTEPKQYV
jgi:hypothetical protein